MSPIQVIRKQLGMSQLKFAQALGVAQRTITNWERKPNSIRLCDVHAIIQLGMRHGVCLSTYDFVEEAPEKLTSVTLKNDTYFPLHVSCGRKHIDIAQGNSLVTVNKKAVQELVGTINMMVSQ